MTMRWAARFSRWSEKLGPVIAGILALQASLAVAALGAQADQSSYPLRADDGSPVANARVPVELARAVEQLPDVVTIGRRDGGIAIAEFYDLNCPYCRKAATDIAEIIRRDKGLKIILVSFSVLSVASIEAARVELAVTQQVTPERFYEFHRKVYAGRGLVDGARAFATAREMGVDTGKLIKAANSDEVTAAMKSHVQLADALELVGTPSFVIKDVAINGYPGRKAIEGIIQSLRRCDNVVC
jgi:protein-disulfide isomerase